MHLARRTTADRMAAHRRLDRRRDDLLSSVCYVKIQSHLAKEKDAWLVVDPVVVVTNYIASVAFSLAVNRE